MVGEIRDRETAEIAIQASLTGHLVLSTIHTNDAAGAITRLVDLGVQPFLVASSLMALLAQRLVRRLCRECRELYKPADEDLASIGIDPAAFAQGKARRVHFKGDEAWVPPPGMLFRAREGGCPVCLGAGYKGRTAIYELLADRREDPAAHHQELRRAGGQGHGDAARGCGPCARTALRRCWPG